MAPSSEVSSIMEGMIFAFELCFLHQTAEIMTLERPEKYCGKIIHDPKWSSNSVLRNHPMDPKCGLLFASNLGLADIPIGTWAALNLLERWGKNFPSAAWGGKPSGYHVSLELKQAVFIGDGCTLENYPMVVWTLHPQGLNEPFMTTILGWFTTTGDLCLGATSQPKWQLGSSTAVRWGQDLPEFCFFVKVASCYRSWKLQHRTLRDGQLCCSIG